MAERYIGTIRSVSNQQQSECFMEIFIRDKESDEPYPPRVRVETLNRDSQGNLISRKEEGYIDNTEITKDVPSSLKVDVRDKTNVRIVDMNGGQDQLFPAQCNTPITTQRTAPEVIEYPQNDNSGLFICGLATLAAFSIGATALIIKGRNRRERSNPSPEQRPQGRVRGVIYDYGPSFARTWVAGTAASSAVWVGNSNRNDTDTPHEAGPASGGDILTGQDLSEPTEGSDQYPETVIEQIQGIEADDPVDDGDSGD